MNGRPCRQISHESASSLAAKPAKVASTRPAIASMLLRHHARQNDASAAASVRTYPVNVIGRLVTLVNKDGLNRFDTSAT